MSWRSPLSFGNLANESLEDASHSFAGRVGSINYFLSVVGIEAQAVGLPCLMSDTVTKDTAITPLVEFFPLHADIKEWAHKLLNYEHTQKRPYPELVRDSGFDIHHAAKDLCYWYENLFDSLQKV